VGFERYAKTTRRAAFLAEMERAVPWTALCALNQQAEHLRKVLVDSDQAVGSLGPTTAP
jgi:hypothetical protein